MWLEVGMSNPQEELLAAEKAIKSYRVVRRLFTIEDSDASDVKGCVT